MRVPFLYKCARYLKHMAMRRTAQPRMAAEHMCNSARFAAHAQRRDLHFHLFLDRRLFRIANLRTADMTDSPINRRALLSSGAALLGGLAMPALLRAQAIPDAVADVEMEAEIVETARHNAMGFRSQRWQDHFQNLRSGAILCDTQSRALHYWSEDENTYLLYPSSVPMTDDFTRLGYTQIVQKRRDPVWIPTPGMRLRDPDLPARVEAGPRNPLGTRAMNLSWEYYRIHGIDNVAKIGRRASNGCIGLFNHHVEVLFELAVVGTQVRFV
jgi:L,D-transpeptidase ErfK/SrfK